MNRESLAFGISGIFFGFLVGWIVGSQRVEPRATPVAPQAAAAPASPATPTNRAVPLDTARVDSLRSEAVARADDPTPRIQLGNLYFDAEQYQEATKWYEEALKLNPKDPNVSTDLGVSYYYLDQPDRALLQFEHSLSVDPKHAKTMLNLGIVRAFGKQDLEGAVAAWERLLEIAPDSPEAQRAKQAIESVRAAHAAG